MDYFCSSGWILKLNVNDQWPVKLNLFYGHSWLILLIFRRHQLILSDSEARLIIISIAMSNSSRNGIKIVGPHAHQSTSCTPRYTFVFYNPSCNLLRLNIRVYNFYIQMQHVTPTKQQHWSSSLRLRNRKTCIGSICVVKVTRSRILIISSANWCCRFVAWLGGSSPTAILTLPLLTRLFHLAPTFVFWTGGVAWVNSKSHAAVVTHMSGWETYSQQFVVSHKYSKL